jgi:hypothetical protein
VHVEVQVAVGIEQAGRQGFIDCIVGVFLRHRLTAGLGGFLQAVVAPVNSIQLAYSPDCTSKGCAPTIESKILISRFDDANEKCKASNHPNQLSALFPSTRPFTTRSTCNGI